MSLDKKIQDTFNPPPSLAGEDWLMPSDSVFNAVENSVFGSKKFKLKGLWMWFGLFLFFISIFFGTILINNSEININPKHSMSSDVSHINNEINLGVGNLKQKEFRFLSEKTNSVDIIQISDIEFESNRPFEESFMIDQTNTFNIKGIEQVNRFQRREIESSLTSSLPSTNNELFYYMPSSIIELNVPLLPLNYERNESFDNEFTDRIAVQVKNLDSQILLLQNGFEIKNSGFLLSPLKRESIWSYDVFFGSTDWQFGLNNDFQTALQPADFQYENGNGYYLQVGLERKLNNRFSFGINTLIERNVFYSGHNSIVDYNINNEDEEMSNDFGLTMASPIGFIESEVIIARSVDAFNNTSLTIDLHNSHSIINVDIGFYTAINLIRYKNLQLSTKIGGGLNHIVNVNNSLDRFSTSEGGFESKQSLIVMDQSGLNNTRPYYSFGLDFGYNWTRRSIVGLRYQRRDDISKAFQFEDYSTKINRTMIGAYIKTDF